MTAKPTTYRFTFGPWNISTGADPFGPPVRDEVAFAAKILIDLLPRLEPAAPMVASEIGGQSVVQTPPSWVHRPSRMKPFPSTVGGFKRRMRMGFRQYNAESEHQLDQGNHVANAVAPDRDVRLPCLSRMLVGRDFAHDQPKAERRHDVVAAACALMVVHCF